MYNEFEYLLQRSSVNNGEEVLQTWAATGGMVATKNTKVYTKGSLLRVDASEGDGFSRAPLHNSIIYVQQTYKVDNKTYKSIDWSHLNEDDVGKHAAAVEGIQLPYFKILPVKWRADFIPDNNFIPYDSVEVSFDSGGVQITDHELEIILTPIGFPFATFDDIEYSRSQICKYMVYPALQRYFSYRPIIDREGPHMRVNRGAQFKVEFPKDAFACIPYYTTPGGAGMMGGTSGSPFAFHNEQVMFGGMMGGMGGRFGRGVRYIGKQVPGFVGLENRNAQIDQLLANQAFMNFFRRERYDRYRDEEGKYWATGFSTIGGNLNFIWLKASTNWEDVKWEDVENIARPLVRIEVLRNFGMLRSLVKQDIPGQLDANVLLTRADAIEEKVNKLLDSIGMTHQYAIMRGGGN